MDDVDLLRKVGLDLQSLQRSPPEPLILDLQEYGRRFGCSAATIEQIFRRLEALRLIDGPGSMGDSWLFRKITYKGQFFLDQVRFDRQWMEIKQHYQSSNEYLGD